MALLYRIDQIRQLEQAAVYQGVTEEMMMRRAAKAAMDIVPQRWPEAQTCAVVCGSGNNGGDGYALALLLKQAGYYVDLWHVGDQGSPLNQQMQQACRFAGLVSERLFSSSVIEADLIVDAMLGIGVRGALRDEYRDAITLINDSHLPILSLDVPSGLCADTGYVGDVAVVADVTITFIAEKPGLWTGHAPDYVGELILSDLDLPADHYQSIAPAAKRLTRENAFALQPRVRTTHKGQCGHVLIVGGDSGMGGAVRMAAEAAARVGAGLVSVATLPQHTSAIMSACPEIMCHGVETAEALSRLLAKATVVVLGPGLGSSDWSHMMAQTVLSCGLPKVVDADGLPFLKEAEYDEQWILTPHPGEAARLLQTTVSHIQRDRFSSVMDLHEAYGGVIVLKGAGTLVYTMMDETCICTNGNPGMASGGMGDVLSGVIAGLLAQGLSLSAAAKMGVWLHANAADLASHEYGERGLLATDLYPMLREILNG